MHYYTKGITKEQYERAMENHKYITDEDMSDIFNISEIYGYGVYGAMVYKRDNKYFVGFHLGNSCD